MPEQKIVTAFVGFPPALEEGSYDCTSEIKLVKVGGELVIRQTLTYVGKTAMTAEQFEQATGRKPEQDDLERVNCKSAGKIGHSGCGWCSEHNSPRFECSFVHAARPV